MHTEHLQNVRVRWVLVGWLIAVAVASLLALALASFGLLTATAEGGTAWATLAVVIGFLAGGLFTGVRAAEAPILHGVAIGLFSILAAFVLNLLALLLFESPPYATLSVTAGLTLIFAQVVAAVLGAWSGYTYARRGGELEV
ncbi:MAG TPA: hypothetical protein VNZ57_08515 [Longimicrobiales bacterium]|nr:hypothetical protein [Longimicrobiales bacterium]